MSNAEGEKLNLLREYRLSQERFYYNLSIISGGTLSLIVTLINSENEIVSSLQSCSRTLLWVSIVFTITSFISSILRNLFVPASVKNIAQDTNQTEYGGIIAELSKEKWYISGLSASSVIFYILGLVIFTSITIQAIL